MADYWIPINDVLREPILILEAVIVLLGLEFGVIFLYRFLKKERGKALILALSTFFFAFAFMVFFFIISDLYVDYLSLPESRHFYGNIAYSILGIGALVFTFNAERELGQKNHIFSIILLGSLIFMAIDFFFVIIEPVYFALVGWVLFVIVLLIYVKKISSKIKEYRLSIYGFFLGVLAYGLGYASTINLMVSSFGSISRFIGDIFIIFGISLISLVFVGLPSLREIDWTKNLNKLLLMHKSGSCICEYDFAGSRKTPDQVSQVIAGSLIGISQLLTELMESKKQLTIMDHQDKQIIFAYGQDIIAALIVDEYFGIYRKKLAKFVENIEIIYSPILEDWDREPIRVKPIEKLIKYAFS